MIFGWKKPAAKSRPKGDWADLFRKLRFFTQDDPHHGLIKFEGVSLSATIHNLNLNLIFTLSLIINSKPNQLNSFPNPTP